MFALNSDFPREEAGLWLGLPTVGDAAGHKLWVTLSGPRCPCSCREEGRGDFIQPPQPLQFQNTCSASKPLTRGRSIGSDLRIIE